MATSPTANIPATTTNAIKFDSKDTFLLTNTGESILTFKVARQKWIIEPGQQAFVPFQLIQIYFGDPRSVPGSRRMFNDSTGEGTIASREEVVDRLKVLYGVYGEDAAKLEDRIPNCTIRTTTGTVVYTPAIDREGNHVQAINNKSVADINSLDDVAAIIAQQERQLEQMRQRMDAMKSNGDNDAEVETDTPDQDMMDI